MNCRILNPLSMPTKRNKEFLLNLYEKNLQGFYTLATEKLLMYKTAGFPRKSVGRGNSARSGGAGFKEAPSPAACFAAYQALRGELKQASAFLRNAVGLEIPDSPDVHRYLNERSLFWENQFILFFFQEASPGGDG
jgi:hypothetical protein